MARATMADAEIVSKTRAGAEERVRPCIALNECIHRKLVDGLVYACGVNPRFGREAEPEPPAAASARSVLVVGGGPAGTELAALCAERGHRVELWERNPHLGGSLAVAALARANHRYQDWIDYQARRLDATGVHVVLDREATVDEVLMAGTDVVAVAVGATPRRPDVPGIDLPHVATIADALRGIVALGPARGRRGRGRRARSAVGRRSPRRARPCGHARPSDVGARPACRQVLVGSDVRPADRRWRRCWCLSPASWVWSRAPCA